MTLVMIFEVKRVHFEIANTSDLLREEWKHMKLMVGNHSKTILGHLNFQKDRDLLQNIYQGS